MPLNSRTQSAGSMLLGKVCASCNGGWMSQLESETKPVWLALFADQPQRDTLDEREVHSLALWSFKTALVLNAASNYRKIIPSMHYSHLFSARGVPADVFIDLGYCPRAQPLTWTQTQTSYGLVLDQDKGALKNCQAGSYNIVLGLPGFLVRIIGLPFPGYTIGVDSDGCNRTRRLHPEPSSIDLRFDGSFAEALDFAVSEGFKPSGMRPGSG